MRRWPGWLIACPRKPMRRAGARSLPLCFPISWWPVLAAQAIPAAVAGGADGAADGTPGVELAALRAATGRKGAEFFAPLRAALTGRLHGPELAPLLRAMPVSLVRERLLAAGRS